MPRLTVPSIVLEDVVSQHAEEVAFLWSQRERAAGSPRHSLATLAKIEGRIDAHVDGLRIAGEAGWRLARARLENADGGEIFSLAVLAFGEGDRAQMLEVLTIGSVSERSRRGLVSALGWLDYERVSLWIRRLLEAKSPSHRAIGLAASVAHRRDPGEMLAYAIDDADDLLRAWAIRAVGELKRRDLSTQVRPHLSDANEKCRYWAAWTLTLLGDRGTMIHLVPLSERPGWLGRSALQLSMRAMRPEECRDAIRQMAKDPARGRLAISAAAALGDSTVVTWLLGQMRLPQFARLAGAAFSMITGADLERLDLDERAPALTESRLEAGEGNALEQEEDEDLPMPNVPLVERWWEQHQRMFEHGNRYLAGKVLTTDAARQILKTGNQWQRFAAAIELALRDPAARWCEVRARTSWQMQWLDQLDVRAD